MVSQATLQPGRTKNTWEEREEKTAGGPGMPEDTVISALRHQSTQTESATGGAGPHSEDGSGMKPKLKSKSKTGLRNKCRKRANGGH